tara:strand:- start:11 stop:553 length:543 start_codon:yes stop_codon:yes gene_type:complete
MGKDKASLLLENKTLIEWAISNLVDAEITNITISVRDQQQAEWVKHLFGNKMKTIVDSEECDGIWDVLKFALPKGGNVQILPVDSPWFDFNAIQLMVKKFKSNSTSIGIVPWSKNGPEPLLMQIDSTQFLNLISTMDAMPLRELVKEKRFQRIDSKVIEEKIGHANALRNLNYPEDLIFE